MIFSVKHIHEPLTIKKSFVFQMASMHFTAEEIESDEQLVLHVILILDWLKTEVGDVFHATFSFNLKIVS